MSSPSELVAVELTVDERDFIYRTLDEWGGSASSQPFPFQMLGLASWEEFGELTLRLERAVSAGEALTDLDWARVLLLTEVTWASTLIGFALDFPLISRFSDEQALHLLRGLQRKIGGVRRARLLFPDGGRTLTAEEVRRINSPR